MKTADFICSSSLQLALYSCFFVIFLSPGRMCRWAFLLLFLFLFLLIVKVCNHFQQLKNEEITSAFFLVIIGYYFNRYSCILFFFLSHTGKATNLPLHRQGTVL